ncbi:MAG: hypothetical protein F6K54_33750 [Okeania sp. SIO3B5]|uniref:hypothetical protein n=1 Tax=Okeania sp. SIO3B5 TaxID=2607811 RepID=UPI0013FE9736|nr:hypothetical protein [Okeania sp. SIO3B5]NEO57602.1 hypothetical protein [Okeania sp. SIO3B5]
MTTNYQKTKENSEKTRFQDPISVENLADNLMEDMFRDIDRVLDGGTRLPTQATKPEVVSLTSIKVPEIVLPQKNTQPPEIDKEEKVKLAKVETEKKQSQSLDKLLLGAAFASILVTLSLWLVNRGGLNKILGYLGYVEKANESSETLSPRAVADKEFAEYIERSLQMIEQKEATRKQQQQIPGIPPAPPSNNLPTVPVPASQPTNTSLLLPLNRLVDLMEAQVAKEPITIPETKVVVIPPVPSVVPSAVAAAPTSAESSPKPSAASASNASASAEAAENVQEKSEATKTEAAKVEEKAKPETAKTETAKTETAKVEEKAKPTEEVATKPEATSQPEASSQSQPETKAEAETQSETEAKSEESQAPTQPVQLPPPPAEIPATSTVTESQVQIPINTLVGILELGERSAALFEVEGVARRIYVGENIGGSGWTLVNVANQEAVIRRNGEVRSVFVGQQF